jgi:hypothetical protein
MIGQTIESRPNPPLGMIFWVLLAVLLDALAAVKDNVHLAVSSLLPWLVAVFLWRIRQRRFSVRFTDTALQVDEPSLTIPYASLQGLLAPRRPANPFKAGPRSYLIQVIHSDGVLCIPGRLNLPSDEVFSFLYHRFSPSGSRAVPSTLADFLRDRERRFHPEQVWTYRTRTHLGQNKRHPQLRAFFLALIVAAGFWLLWGIVQREEGWIVCGGLYLFFGVLFSLFLWLIGRRSFAGIPNWRQSGLVIAPDGLALVQGDLVGELRWDEVRDVTLGKASSAFSFTISFQPIRGIVLKVAGAVIVIADIYDRPIALIYQNIHHYWRGQSLDDRDREGVSGGADERFRPSLPGTSLPRSSEDVTPLE